MKSLIWILCVALVVVAVTVVTAPKFGATLRQNCRYGAAQPPEGQALLGQEWARANSRMKH